jgi:tRNA 5-methylaminomethyl-2-thiouridine biosynthesis bifunctional protein
MSPVPATTTVLPGALEPEWLEDGTPFAREFGDVYYSREGGCAESRYVFLQQNALAERWTALADEASRCFVIGETGFGTGLNFLLSWELWRRTAPPRARLLFRSLEARPLGAAALQRALAAWPELRELALCLVEAWPPCLPGLHTLEFDAGRVTLQLWVGEAATALDELLDSAPAPAVEAWFLDGFAPARNPAMWTDEVLARIGATSRTGATLATFTSAAAVRRGLERAGFSVRKHPGFGRKREMLCATRGGTVIAARSPAVTPWHRAMVPPPQERSVLVIGAGIAGCTTARALARRGWAVTVLEAAVEPAMGASGNPQALLFTQLAAADSAHAEFTLASFLHATRHHAAVLGGFDGEHARCALLQLADTATVERLRTRYAALPELVRFVDREEASALAGVALASGGLFLPASGWVDPRAACSRVLAHPRIELHCGAEVIALERDGALWRASTRDARHFAAGTVVLANAGAVNTLLGAEALPLAPIRGQLTLLPANALPGTPRCALCADGYLVPPRDGIACCGASFRRGEPIGEPTLAEHRRNLAHVAAMLPGFDPASTDVAALAGRVAERCATPDRLPAVGRVPDGAAFRETFAALRHNARRVIARCGHYNPGLLVNVGHGSRGMTSAPLAAEIIAAELGGEPAPVSQRVLRALSPARFVVREIVRGGAR